MSDERRGNPRFDEEMSFTFAPGGPVDYAASADGPVRYVEVVDDRGLLGFLWFQDAADAADFIPCESRDLDALKAGVVWGGRLREQKERGLAPSQAVADLGAQAGTDDAGRVAAGEPAEAESEDALRALAGRR